MSNIKLEWCCVGKHGAYCINGSYIIDPVYQQLMPKGTPGKIMYVVHHPNENRLVTRRMFRTVEDAFAFCEQHINGRVRDE